MATTQLKKKGKLGGKRVWIAVGVVALLVVAYLWYQSRSGNSLTSPLSTGAPTDQGVPSSLDTGGASGGGAGDTGTGTDPTAALLSTLAGENQQLLGSLLSSQQGLVSLAGSSLGAPTQSVGSEEIAAPVAPLVTSDASGVSSDVSAPSIASYAPAAVQQANQIAAVATSDQTVSAPDFSSLFSNVDTVAAQDQLAATQPITGGTFTNPAVQQLPTTQAEAPRSGGTSSNKKQGVYSTH